MRRVSLAAVFALGIVGCHDPSAPEKEKENKPVIQPTQPGDEIKVTVTLSVSAGYQGDTARISGTVRRNGVVDTAAKLQWISRDGTVATVDAEGRIKLFGIGSSWIVGQFSTGKDSARILSAAAFFVWPDTLRLLPGGSHRAAAEIYDYRGQTFPQLVGGATWSTSNESVATVDQNGQIVAQSNGAATITAQIGSRSSSAHVVVAPISATLRFTDIAIGDNGACGLAEDGIAWCWGRYRSDDPAQPSSRCESFMNYPPYGTSREAYVCTAVPVPISTSLRFSRVFRTHGSFPVAIDANGKLYTLGETGAVPYMYPGPYKSVIGFRYTSCGIRPDDIGECWGWNSQGSLGIGVGQDGGPYPGGVHVISGGLRWLALDAAASSAVCGLTLSGAAYCWGDNSGFRLGIGPDSTIQPGCRSWCATVPTAVKTSERFVQIASAFNATCGLTAEGVPYCWGFLGYLSPLPRSGAGYPVKVSAPPFVSIEGFGSFPGSGLCGITSDGAAHCLTSTISPSSYDTQFGFTPLALPMPVRRIVFGTYVSCLHAVDGKVYCWGAGAGGRNGDASYESATVANPRLVAGQPPI